jgi:hypothetical protein
VPPGTDLAKKIGAALFCNLLVTHCPPLLSISIFYIYAFDLIE